MQAFHFVGTPLQLTEQEAYHLHKYKKKHKSDIAVWRQFDIDLTALLTPVQLDCLNCHAAHRESCCEGGYPFPPSEELLPVIDEHLPAILELLPASAQVYIRENGLYEQHLETAGYQTVGAAGGNCLFCQVEGAGPACMAHRHALRAQMHPAELKPLSCLLYPLDLIQDQAGRIFVTALTGETAKFSRWGAEYRRDFLCGNRELREQAAAGGDVSGNVREDVADDVFALHRYRPAYIEGRDTLVHLYGEAFWQTLAELLGGTDTDQEGETPSGNEHA